MSPEWIKRIKRDGKWMAIVKAKDANGVEKWQTVPEWAEEPGCLFTKRNIQQKVSRANTGTRDYNPQEAVGQEEPGRKKTAPKSRNGRLLYKSDDKNELMSQMSRRRLV
jgi:hypothetical protein